MTPSISHILLAQDLFELTDGLLLVGLMLVIAALFMWGRKRMARRARGEELTAHEHLERLKQKDGLKNDLNSLMVEIEQLAKRLGAQLDAKSMQLERLIDDAEAAAQRLERLSHQAGTQTPASTHPTDEVIEGQLEDEPDPTPPQPAQSPASSPAGNGNGLGVDEALTHQVYTLADQGVAPVEIAHQLDEHVGKIELILALRQK